MAGWKRFIRQGLPTWGVYYGITFPWILSTFVSGAPLDAYTGLQVGLCVFSYMALRYRYRSYKQSTSKERQQLEGELSIVNDAEAGTQIQQDLFALQTKIDRTQNIYDRYVYLTGLIRISFTLIAMVFWPMSTAGVARDLVYAHLALERVMQAYCMCMILPSNASKMATATSMLSMLLHRVQSLHPWLLRLARILDVVFQIIWVWF